MLDLEARLEPKMETPPKDIVGNVHALPVGRSAKSISRHFTKSNLAKSFKDAWMYADHFVPQLHRFGGLDLHHLGQATYVANNFLAPSSRARHRWTP